jgi:hypothetical protein
MWLYIPKEPSTSCRSALESEDSTSESTQLSEVSALTLAQSAMWRGKHMQHQYWRSKWKKESWIRLLSGATLRPSLANSLAVEWILSLEDTHASHSPLLDEGKARKTQDISGPMSCECLLKLGPLFSSAKTCAAMSPKVLGKFSGKYPASGSMRSGTVTPLKKRAHRIEGRGSSFLPTPTAMPYGSNKGGAHGRVGKDRLSLGTMAKKNLWPTPTVKWNHNRKGLSTRSGDGLATAVKRLPTPTTQDAHNNGGPAQGIRNTPPLNSVAGGPLNPTWVEWLMGFPTGWTGLEH